MNLKSVLFWLVAMAGAALFIRYVALPLWVIAIYYLAMMGKPL